jgi:hypothetical protein
MNIDWFMKDYTRCYGFECPHINMWKLKINKVSNIMILDKPKCRDTSSIALVLKVIKFSAYEVILEDVTRKPNPIRYFFGRTTIK